MARRCRRGGRVWWTTVLALLEPMQDLVDVLSREFFDFGLLLVRERLELIVPIAR
jgi:hypothetical protein